MTVVVIAYPPSAGGNHLKNMLCLDTSFENSSDLDVTKYTSGEREVHSTSGRNMQEDRMQQAETGTGDYILHGHFGELAPWRSRINSIQNKKFVIISIDTQRDKFLLDQRQHRLGQWGHEYYLYEEQPFLYTSALYQTYFTSQPENIYTITLNDFWHPNLAHYKIIDQLNSFLNKNIDPNQAQDLHRYWYSNNNIDFY
jgi:hypothetical protein